MTPRRAGERRYRTLLFVFVATCLCAFVTGYVFLDRAGALSINEHADVFIDVGAPSKAEADEVSRALAKGNFPWYDAEHDEAKAIYPPESWGEWFWKTRMGRWIESWRWSSSDPTTGNAG